MFNVMRLLSHHECLSADQGRGEAIDGAGHKMWYVLQMSETLHIDYPQKRGINVWVKDR